MSSARRQRVNTGRTNKQLTPSNNQYADQPRPSPIRNVSSRSLPRSSRSIADLAQPRSVRSGYSGYGSSARSSISASSSLSNLSNYSVDSSTASARRRKVQGTDLIGQIRDKVAQTEKISKVFRKFDVDKDGKVDHEEFKNGLRSMGFLVSRKDANKLIREIDKDNSGAVDYREFCKTMIDEAYEKNLDAKHEGTVFRS